MNVFSFSATQHMCVCLTYVASPGFCCLRVLRKEERDTDRSSFLINGSEVLEDLIVSFDGKSNPIRNYSADELIKATNNFDCFKLLGCCLEFPIPALVHEYATIGVLNDEGGFGATESLTWKARLGKQLANALTYLHTAFPRPIILRDLNFSCIYLGHDYVPKLSYFGLSITIPPMKSYAEDEPKGRFGYSDPAHITSGIISEKGDVYSFGVLLLIFLTGQKAVVTNQDGEYESINSYVKFRTCNGQIQSFVDPKIFGEVGK
ncbi:non-functional pseudokinase ZRK2 [Rosa chinensis]|uniref:non-functional pseudokinase ZRK2 n=1 Tax=Rosa chinensis TaxID=74649 RepID=UPI000D093CA6|nr:non-functional pseudokinase ZRK2 [Rosa chinensis]